MSKVSKESVRYGPALSVRRDSWPPVHWVVFVLVVGLFGWLVLHLPFGLARL